ncbi:SoxY-related AACIE arm protein [Roseicella aerolata]|uniref:SoxY-related AACIE arm protein n=1 Tax=Roseicella aerolata TaxID=2883479 RepID=A0A9X1L736_9PROT|nr:SoxY-related AACIE arm protein [Roseicella aerolata]MCB4821139.1 SoxY-related AACIE arm protein [Roseicella aerolata]
MSSPSWSRCATERRTLLGGLLAVTLLRPASAAPEAMAQAIRGFTGGAVPQPGGINLEIPPLVENGNAVPVSIEVESPMTEAEHVRAIALFSERNPLPNVLTVKLGPWSGAARIGTRIRLATSQRLMAIAALSDGSFRLAEQQVVVTLAACIEG